MSNNPYSPPESDPSQSQDELALSAFPFWLIGPLPWASLGLMINVMTLVAFMIRNGLPPSGAIWIRTMGGFLISVFIYAGAGAIYGLFYAYSISRICRILQRTPRVKPHFLAIHLILMLAIMIHMAPATMIVAATVAGIIVAVANPVKRVQTDGGSPFDTE